MDPIERSRRLADDVLFPAADGVDAAASIPAAHLRALADEGMMGITGPVEVGGSDLGVAGRRAVFRNLSSGCGATTFVWVQHLGVVARLRRTTNAGLRDRWLPSLVRGEALAGTAFAHVRRSGPPALEAVPDGDGWRFRGRAPWASSWGLAGVYTVAATTSDGRVVWALLPGTERDRLRAGPPMELAVMTATRTVELAFDDLPVPVDAVLDVVDRDEWARSDRVTAARLNPGPLGVADRCVRLLEDMPDDDARAAAASVGAALERWCATDEALAAEADPGRLAAHRARGLEIVTAAVVRLLAAARGAAMSRSHPGQRLHREAGFWVVQAQTADGRAATLRRDLPG